MVRHKDQTRASDDTTREEVVTALEAAATAHDEASAARARAAAAEDAGTAGSPVARRAADEPAAPATSKTSTPSPLDVLRVKFGLLPTFCLYFVVSCPPALQEEAVTVMRTGRAVRLFSIAGEFGEGTRALLTPYSYFPTYALPYYP